MNKTIQYLCAGIALLCGTFNVSTAVEKRLQREQARTELRKMMEDATTAERRESKDAAYAKAQNFIEQQIKRGVLSRHHVRKTTADIRVQLASKAELEKERLGKVSAKTKKQIANAEKDLEAIDEGADATQANNNVTAIENEIKELKTKRGAYLNVSIVVDDNGNGKQYKDKVDKIRTFIAEEESLFEDGKYEDAKAINKEIQALEAELGNLYEKIEKKETDQDKKDFQAIKEIHKTFGRDEKISEALEEKYTELEEAKEKAAEELKEQEATLKKQQEEVKAKLQKETELKEEKEKIIDTIIGRQARIFTWKDYLAAGALNNANFAGNEKLTKNQNTKDNLKDKDLEELKAYAKKLNGIKKTARDSAFTYFVIMSKLAQHIIRNFEDNKEAIKNLEIQRLDSEEKQKVGNNIETLKKLTLSIADQGKMNLLEGAPKERIEILIADLEAINKKLKDNDPITADLLEDIKRNAPQAGLKEAKAYEKHKKNKK